MMPLDVARPYVTCELMGELWVVTLRSVRPGIGYVRYKGPDEERARQVHANVVLFVAQLLHILRSEGRFP